MKVVKWKFDDIEIDRNPDTFALRPEKKVMYRPTIDGEEVRISPPRDAVSMYLEIGWRMIDEKWRNMFHDWFMQDKKFTLRTHLTDNPRDVWTVKIDEFNAPYLLDDKWDLTLKLAVVDLDNDPILRQTYSEKPHLFVIQNDTNIAVHDSFIFLRPLAGESKILTFDGKIPGNLEVPHTAYRFAGVETPSPYAEEWSELDEEEYISIYNELIFFEEDDFIEDTLLVDEDYLFDDEDDVSEIIKYMFGLDTYIQAATISGEGYSHGLFVFNAGDIDEALSMDGFTVLVKGYGYGYDGEEAIYGDGNFGDVPYGSEMEKLYGMDVYLYNYESDEYEFMDSTNEDDVSEIDIEVSRNDVYKYVSQSGYIFVLVKTSYPSSIVEPSSLVINYASLTTNYKYIKNPSVKQTFLNLLSSPGFEDGLDGWSNEDDAWELDYVFYYEGAIGVKTSVEDKQLYQDVLCPPDEELTVMFTTRGDKEEADAITVTVTAIDAGNTETQLESKTYDVTYDHTTHWFAVQSPTPEGTRKVRLSFMKKNANTNHVYVDRVLLRLGASDIEPVWTSHPHQTLKFNGVVGSNDVLRLNLGNRIADINGLESVTDRLSGNWFSLPIGRSMIIIDDEGGNLSSEAVIRYNEVYV